MHRSKCRLLALTVTLTGGSAGADNRIGLDRFRCSISGHWDNVRQAQRDVVDGLEEFARHPVREMTYVPVTNPNIEGQLFAILNYTEQGFGGPVARVSVHRFRSSPDEQRIVHEFMIPNEPDMLDDLMDGLATLTRIREDDVHINTNCAMYWRWR